MDERLTTCKRIDKDLKDLAISSTEYAFFAGV
jgi:hypothetical protein